MDVDIDIGWLDSEIDEVWHLFAHRYESLEGCHHRLVEVGMLHVAPVDKEILLGAFLLGCFGLAHISLDAAEGGLDLYGDEVAVHLASEDVGNALAETSGAQIEHLGAVAREGKGYVGIDQRDALECGDDVSKLGGIGLEKLAACGNVVEEVLDEEVASRRARTWFLTCEA